LVSSFDKSGREITSISEPPSEANWRVALVRKSGHGGEREWEKQKIKKKKTCEGGGERWSGEEDRKNERESGWDEGRL
jgi:hypothetical protein